VAKKRAISADFRLDNSGGTLTDISTQVRNVQFSRDAALYDVTTFQSPNGDKEFLVGFKDNKISFDGFVDATIATHLNGILGQEATVTFNYGPEGTTSGNRKFSGEAVLVSYNETGVVDDVNKFTAQLQITGQVTVGTY